MSSHLISSVCVCVCQQGSSLLANYICVLHTCKLCPIVGDLISSPMEGTRLPAHFKFNITLTTTLVNYICVLHTCKLCPIVRDLIGSPMEGTRLPAHFKFNITLTTTLCHPLLPSFQIKYPLPHITNYFSVPPPKPLKME